MNKNDINIDEVIKRAVNEGIAVGYSLKQQQIKDYYKQAEKRLYAYNSLKDGIKAYAEEINELKMLGLPKKSKSIVFMPSGSRVNSQDLQYAKIQDLEYKIQRNERELKDIEAALDLVRNDNWYKIIELKYLETEVKNDTEIAESLGCDESTVRRNKKRLMNKIVIRFYGADAL